MNKLLKILKTAFVVIFAFIVTGCNKDEQAPTKDAFIVDRFNLVPDSNSQSVIQQRIEAAVNNSIKLFFQR